MNDHGPDQTMFLRIAEESHASFLMRKTCSLYLSTTAPRHNRLRMSYDLVAIRVDDCEYCLGCSLTMPVQRDFQLFRPTVPCENRPTNILETPNGHGISNDDDLLAIHELRSSKK